MESAKNVIDVRACAFILSEMNPADIPPSTPPTLKTVERIPADFMAETRTRNSCYKNHNSKKVMQVELYGKSQPWMDTYLCALSSMVTNTRTCKRQVSRITNRKCKAQHQSISKHRETR